MNNLRICSLVAICILAIQSLSFSQATPKMLPDPIPVPIMDQAPVKEKVKQTAPEIKNQVKNKPESNIRSILEPSVDVFMIVPPPMIDDSRNGGEKQDIGNLLTHKQMPIVEMEAPLTSEPTSFSQMIPRGTFLRASSGLVIARDMAPGLPPVNLTSFTAAPDNSGNNGQFPGSSFDVFGKTDASVNYFFSDFTTDDVTLDFFGFIPDGDTDEFFGCQDLTNGDNLSGMGTATWVFDISGIYNVDSICIDFAAMGDFELSNDGYTISASIDGAPAQVIFDIQADESDSYTYSLANGNMNTLNDPMHIDVDGNGSLDGRLINQLATYTSGALKGQSGTTLTLTLDAMSNAQSEVFGFRNIVVTGALGCVAGATVYVDSSSTGANNGSSWTDAFTDLQDALDMARNCPNVEEIWVADGTYYPAVSDRDSSFVMVDSVKIYGGFAGGETELSQRDWTLNPTILSGDIGTPGDNSDNSYQVIDNITNGLDFAACLDGFIVTGGNANGGGVLNNGGGMINFQSAPIIRNCRFTRNLGGFGGAVYNELSSPLFDSCVFAGNLVSTSGGAMYNLNQGPIITACNFMQNTAGVAGGAVLNQTANTSILDCRFEQNRSNNQGGAIWNSSNSNLSISMGMFIQNEATNFGGAIASFDAVLNIDSSNFSQDSSGTGGGALALVDGTVNVSNSIFTENHTLDLGGAIYVQDIASLSIENAQFTNNRSTGGIDFGFGGAIFLTSGDDITSIVSNSHFEGNSCGGGGGAIFSGSSASTTVSNNTFFSNFVDDGGTIGTGGALQFTNGTNIVENCLIYDNHALGIGDDGGGGIMIYGGAVEVVNSTIVNNSSTAKGGGISLFNFQSPSLTLRNSILWNNSAPAESDIFNFAGGPANVEYSLLNGMVCPANVTCGDGMIYNQDPMFVGPMDFHLQAGSPAIDAGTIIGGAGFDIDGNPRPGGPTHDMGVYEIQTPCSPTNWLVTSDADAGAGTLREAIVNGCIGDTIRFAPNVTTILLDSQLVIAKDVVIIGDAVSKTVLDGKDKTRICYIANEDLVELWYLTLENGHVETVNSEARGGAILADGTLEGNHCMFKNNKCSALSDPAHGGAIYSASQSPLRLLDCKFIGNSVSNRSRPSGITASSGGAIRNLGSKAEIRQCLFESNAVSAADLFIVGGAIRSQLDTLILDDCSFNKNGLFPNGNDNCFGGGLYYQSCVAIITNTIFDENVIEAPGGSDFSSGGGVGNFDANSLLYDVTFSNNKIINTASNAQGGGISNSGPLAQVFGNRLTIVDNEVSCANQALGGGIFCRGSVDLDNTLISGNNLTSAGGFFTQGGGLYVWIGQTLNLRNSLITGNYLERTNDGAAEGGGLSGGILNFVNTTITGNNVVSANGVGGGIAAFNSFAGTNVILWDNTANTSPHYATFGTGTFAFSLVQNDPLGASNLDGTDPGNNPNFLDPRGPALAPTSEGNYRMGCGAGPLDQGFDAANALPTDLDGSARIVNTIDLGPYERIADTTTHIVTNVNDAGAGSLRLLVDYACVGDTIRFIDTINMDTIKLITGQIDIRNNLVIIGNDTTNTIVDGSDMSRVFQSQRTDTVQLWRLTIQNGNSDQGGGMFAIGPLSLHDCLFRHNTCRNDAGNAYGGGLTAGDTLYAENSAFRDNMVSTSTTTALGGGIYLYGGFAADLRQCRFSDNISTSLELASGGALGGGIASLTGVFTFTGCNFIRNEAMAAGNAAYGGGVFSTSGPVALGSCNFIENVATSVKAPGLTIGGAVMNFSGRFEIDNCDFIANEARGSGGGIYGGAIFSQSDSLIVNNTRFTNNSIYADSSGFVLGGAVCMLNGPVKVSNSMIRGNHIVTSDSAVYVYAAGIYNQGASLELLNVDVIENYINTSGSLILGGGLTNLVGKIVGNEVKVSNNSITAAGTVYGGGIAGYYPVDSLILCNSEISGNSIINTSDTIAAGGGIGYFEGFVELRNSLLTGNRTISTIDSARGGGIHATTVKLANSTVSGNRADGSISIGGGIYDSVLVATNTIIWNNEAVTDPEMSNQLGETINYSLVRGQNPAGDGNLDGTDPNTDPLFNMPITPALAPNSGGDYSLMECSDVINFGINDSLGLKDTLDVIGNMRVIDMIVDMGAYEYQGVQPKAVAGCVSSAVLVLDSFMMAAPQPAMFDSLSTGDVCGIDTFLLSQSDFNCTDIGQMNMELIVVANNGTRDTCTFSLDILPGIEYCRDNMDNDCDTEIDEEDAGGYCCVSGLNPMAYIDEVGLYYPLGSPVNFVSSGPDPMGYGNYRDPKSNIASSFVPFVYFSVKPGLNRVSYIRIWVDWNQNNQFDAFEMMSQNITNTTWNGQFSVPFILRNIPGEYSVRIGLSQRGYIDDPCDEASRGEYEDYVICIANGCPSPIQLPMSTDELSIGDNPIGNLQSSIRIQVRPNPFVDNLILETMLPNTGEMRITILNQQGQTISTQLIQGSKGFNQFELETFSMAAGMYYIRVQSGDDVIVKRIVKQ